jgi:single-stranded-DNA-specific exonuclease
VRHGLEILKHSKKPGVRALMDVAGVSAKTLSPGHLGFVIGPRINASGRMGSASLALELLTTTDAMRGAELAHELERVNKERADTQNRIWDEVRKKVEFGLAEGKFAHGIVVADASWHEGVVGIVASRVTETFRKPAAVIALREDFGKGSVRSFGGKDVLSAMRAAGEHLLGFGGHKHAAGLSVALDKVQDFADAFDRALGQIEEDASARPLFIEGDCAIEDLDLKTMQEIEALGPFGPGNPEPVFSFKAEVRGHQILKGRHLKLNLAAPGSREALSRTQTIEAIWFHAAERQDAAEVLTSQAEWAGVPELNRFRGRVTPTLRIRDWRSLKI